MMKPMFSTQSRKLLLLHFLSSVILLNCLWGQALGQDQGQARIQDLWESIPSDVAVPGNAFGSSLAVVGDVDQNGHPDLAVGATGDPGGGKGRGAVWLFLMQEDGPAQAHKISVGRQGFQGALKDGDFLGRSVTPLGDINGDGIPDLAAGAFGDDDGGNFRGAVWIFFLTPAGRVASSRKISQLEGGFDGSLADGDQFGIAIHSPGDINRDGTPDLVAGAMGDDEGGRDRGAIWILFLNPDGTVKGHSKISDQRGGLPTRLGDGDNFGSAVTSLKMPDGGSLLAVGARGDDDPAQDAGAVWLLSLNAAGQITESSKLGSASPGLQGIVRAGAQFGFSASACRHQTDGFRLVVGAPRLGGSGGTWLLSLSRTGSVRRAQLLSAKESGIARLGEASGFGFSVACTGDLDGDQIPDGLAGANAVGGRRGEILLMSRKSLP